jgi:hypothetical protein
VEAVQEIEDERDQNDADDGDQDGIDDRLLGKMAGATGSSG